MKTHDSDDDDDYDDSDAPTMGKIITNGYSQKSQNLSDHHHLNNLNNMNNTRNNLNNHNNLTIPIKKPFKMEVVDF